MNEDIDYSAVIASLQHENERLRLHLVKLMDRNDYFSSVQSLYFKYKDSPYLKIVMSMLAVYVILACIQTITKVITKGFHHER